MLLLRRLEIYARFAKNSHINLYNFFFLSFSPSLFLSHAGVRMPDRLDKVSENLIFIIETPLADTYESEVMALPFIIFTPGLVT